MIHFSRGFQVTLPNERIRLDDYLFVSELVNDKTQIKSLILSGSVLVNDRPITKAGSLIYKTDSVRLREKIKKFVSRGAYKLLGAFDAFSELSVFDLVCLDLGASTGGFTQVLLEKGAKHVYAVDVGYGLLAQRIANDPRVTVLDRTHIKDLKAELFPLKTSSVFVSMDLSFISLTKVFPFIANLSKELNVDRLFGISLVKPQFEVATSKLVRGIVEDRLDQIRTLRQVWREIKKNNPNFHFSKLAESPITGADGNHEFLLKWSLDKKR